MTPLEYARNALAELASDQQADLSDQEILEKHFVQAIAAERESCARLAETWGPRPPRPGGSRSRLAADIRARGTK